MGKPNGDGARVAALSAAVLIAAAVVVGRMSETPPEAGVTSPGVADNPAAPRRGGGDMDRQAVEGASEQGQEPAAPTQSPSPSDLVQAMHLREAPRDLQQSYVVAVDMEIAAFQKRVAESAASSTASMDDYLSFLLASRDARMRELAKAELLAGRGVLCFDGLKPVPDAARPKVGYVGVGSFHGRQADLIVWIGGEDGSLDPQIAALSESIQQVAMNLAGDLLARFNQRPREARRADLEVYRSRGTLPGFSGELMYLVRSRLRMDEASDVILIF